MRPRWWLLAGAMACTGGADPALVAKKEALERWEEGREALGSGDPSAARAAFAQALARQPDDPVLLAWRGRAEAADGDLTRAISTLDEALAAAPSFSEARYNRAAYLARDGQLDAAATGLREALAAGAADPRDVLSDADFAPHLDHPGFSFLPRSPVALRVEGPGGAVFAGSDAVVKLTATGRNVDGLTLTAPAVDGPFRLVRLEERVESGADQDGRLTLTWTLRALGPGQLTVGPFTLSDTRRTATTDAVAVVAVAADGAEPAPRERVTWQRAAGVAGPDLSAEPAAVAWTDAGALWVRTPMGSRVVQPSQARPVFRATRVEGRQDVWTLARYAPSEPVVRVLIKGNGGTLFEGPPRKSRP